MVKSNELEKYLDFAMYGAPEIRGEEKRYWLGEFRERVVFAVAHEQIGRREIFKIIEEKAKDARVDKVIVDGKLGSEATGKIMEICKKEGKDFRTISNAELKGEIALVMASHEAVNIEKVLLRDFPLIPEKYNGAKSKKLCKNHMKELVSQAPMYADEFEEITFFDKMVGIKCGVCDEDPQDGVMM